MGDIGHFVKFKNLLDDIGYLMQDEVFKKIFNKNVINPHTKSNNLKVNLISFEKYINDDNYYKKEQSNKEVKYPKKDENGIHLFPSLMQKVQNRNIIMLNKKNTISQYGHIANSFGFDGYNTYAIDNINKINHIVTSYISKQIKPKIFLFSTSINSLQSYLSLNQSLITPNAFILYQNMKEQVNNAQKNITLKHNVPFYIYNTIPSLDRSLSEIYSLIECKNKIMISTTHISKKEPLLDSIYLNDIKYWLSHI